MAWFYLTAGSYRNKFNADYIGTAAVRYTNLIMLLQDSKDFWLFFKEASSWIYLNYLNSFFLNSIIFHLQLNFSLKCRGLFTMAGNQSTFSVCWFVWLDNHSQLFHNYHFDQQKIIYWWDPVIIVFTTSGTFSYSYTHVSIHWTKD